MATITLSVPDKLKDKMDKVEIINWSSVARQAFKEQLEDIEQLKKLKRAKEIVSKSKFTKEDVDIFSKKVKKAMHDDLVKKGLI